MKWSRLITPLISLALLISLAVPAFADEPPPPTVNMEADVIVVGDTVDTDINVIANTSVVTVHAGPAADITINQTAGPSSVKGNVSGGLIVAGVNDTNVTVNQENQSTVNIAGGRNPMINLNGNENSTINYTTQVVQTFVPSDLGSYINALNRNIQVVNEQIIPAIKNLKTEADNVEKVIVKLINDGKVSAAEAETLQSVILDVQENVSRIDEQLASLGATDDQLVSDIIAVQNLAAQQAQLINTLVTRVSNVEQRQYAQEHSGIVYNVKTFFTSTYDNAQVSMAIFRNNIRSSFGIVLTNIKGIFGSIALWYCM